MPHIRQRYLTEIIKKRLRFFPVLGIQGARQVGKSALVRDLLPELITHFHYETFDQQTVFQFAQSNPESFIEAKMLANGTLAIDEAQKVPSIFDAVKFQVDKKKAPGQFILLGSTEFSKRTLIRESLTGRIGMLRLYPFTLSEAMQLPCAPGRSALHVHKKSRASRSQLMRHLQCGGMPGAFHIRDESTRQIFFKEWLNLIVLRDLMLIPRVKLNPDLALKILELMAEIELPSLGHIAKALAVDPRRIRTHIEALEALFVIHKLNPHPSGAGQPIYLHCDVGLASFLGARLERQLQTWVLQELLANAEWREDLHEKIFFYQTPKRSVIHFVLEGRTSAVAMKIIAKEAVTELDVKILQSFPKKLGSKPIELIALGPQVRSFDRLGVKMMPWESIV